MAKRQFVYILEESVPYEGAIFYGVYSTFLKAEDAKNKEYAYWATVTPPQDRPLDLSIRTEQLNVGWRP